MFNIYTSYFSNKKLKNKHNDMMFIPVCNRLYVNSGYADWYRELSPDPIELERFHNSLKPDKERFTDKYIKKLHSLRKDHILDKYVDDLLLRVRYEDVVLLCYENKKEFCHRHILAQYLNDYYNLRITEY
ncbi:MAG: DUF488 family protein [Romboutsia sp.]|nr:DUF488 family protein [Romboutsia sp.]